jgi:hypothetical protein
MPDKVRLMLRREALGWLRESLAQHAKQAEQPEAAARQAVCEWMRRWQQDADLAPVRDPAALEKLPEDERAAWRALWADVDALLKKVKGKE